MEQSIGSKGRCGGAFAVACILAAGDPSVRGLEVYFSGSHHLAEATMQLASELLGGVLAELEAIGRPVVNRGVRDDSCLYSFRNICRGIFVISPARVITRDDIIRFGRDPESIGFPAGVESVATRATTMPSALVELLFVTNPKDATMLADESARDALARGVANGIISFVETTSSAS